MNKRVLRDQDARDRIANDLDTCLLVEAGAGSGKTASLVIRMVNLIREGRCTMNSLAAVTFTRSGAEMSALSTGDGEGLPGGDGQWEKERLAAGLRRLNGAYWYHSLLLRPAAAGAGPWKPGWNRVLRRWMSLRTGLFHRRVWNDYLQEVRLTPGETGIYRKSTWNPEICGISTRPYPFTRSLRLTMWRCLFGPDRVRRGSIHCWIWRQCAYLRSR